MEKPVGLEAALGTIVFGPYTNDLGSIAYTIDMLRRAAGILELRYAEVRHMRLQQAAEITADQQGQQLSPAGLDGGQQQGQLSPAKPKRKRGRPSRANGATEHGPDLATPPAGEPLFPAEGAVE